MGPKVLTTAEYQKLQENITKELNVKSNPDEVPRVVISVASSLNYDNKTDSETQEQKKKVITIFCKEPLSNTRNPFCGCGWH